MFPSLFTFIRIDRFTSDYKCDGDRQRDIIDIFTKLVSFFLACITILQANFELKHVQQKNEGIKRCST